jgi:hypothetical protein
VVEWSSSSIACRWTFWLGMLARGMVRFLSNRTFSRFQPALPGSSFRVAFHCNAKYILNIVLQKWDVGKKSYLLVSTIVRSPTGDYESITYVKKLEEVDSERNRRTSLAIRSSKVEHSLRLDINNPVNPVMLFYVGQVSSGG